VQGVGGHQQVRIRDPTETSFEDGGWKIWVKGDQKTARSEQRGEKFDGPNNEYQINRQKD